MQQPKRMATAFATALVGLLALSACGGGSAPSASGGKSSSSTPAQASSSGPAASSPAASSSTPTTTIRFGVLVPKQDAGFDYMAQAQGFFAKHHLNVVYVPLQNSTSLNQALLAGKVDIAEVSPGGALGIDAKTGKPSLKVIGATLSGMEHGLYAAKGITSLSQLKGKTFATATGSFSQVLMKLILEQSHMSPNAVKWLNISGSSSEEFKAVLAGKAAASIGSLAMQAQIPKSSGVHVLLKVADKLPKYVRLTLVSSDSFLKKNPDATVSFLEAEAEGLRYAIGHKGAEINLAAQKTKLKPTDPSLTLMYNTVVDGKLASLNLDIAASRITYMEQLNMQLGRQKNMIPASEVMDMRFQQKAIAAIGTYKGQ